MPGYSDIAKQYLEQNPYSPEPIAPVTQARNSREARSEELGAVNARMQNQEAIGQSFIREGEVKAQGAAQSAGVLQQSKADASEIHSRAMQRLEGNQALQDQYRKMAERDLAGVKERGMANWGPLLTGIVGAMAGAGGNQGMAQGMSMLGSVIERSAQAKAQNAATTFEGHNELARTAMADSTNAVDAATKLMAQEHELAARDLERIAQETSIPVYREGALRLAEGTREQALNLLQGYKAAEAGRQEAQEARMAKAAGPKKQELNMTEIMAKFQAGTITPAEAKSLPADMQKAMFGAEKPAAAERTAANIPGYTATQDIDKADASKAKGIVAAGRSLEADLDRLAAIRKAHGDGGTVMDRDAVREAGQIMSGISSKYSQLFGAGAPSEAERQAFKESIPDPTGFYPMTDPNKVYEELRNQIRKVSKDQLSAYGYQPEQQAAAPQAQAPALKTLRLKGQ